MFRAVLATDVELCLGVVAPQCVVVMMMMGGHFARAPFSRWVGLGFPPGGFSRSLPLRDAVVRIFVVVVSGEGASPAVVAACC